MSRYEEYVQKLESAGFTTRQAMAQFSVLEDFMLNKMATKDDLIQLELKIEKRFNDLENRFNGNEGRFNSIDSRFNNVEASIVDLKKQTLVAFSEHSQRLNGIERRLDRMFLTLLLGLGALLAAVGAVIKFLSP
jgi:hypothetical protein